MALTKTACSNALYKDPPELGPILLSVARLSKDQLGSWHKRGTESGSQNSGRLRVRKQMVSAPSDSNQ
ncbi:hypothetical protein AMTR_s00105p00152390 [Amborella trichopoda]|uniref:Uncharacterized protein n=1 Tax=Amborella trichopoda TaxID=13333 RepID=W1NSJ4_AMBTC|nr:hypothetical protein AMTR_s00105p00152390 [Amborella trichopoda]